MRDLLTHLIAGNVKYVEIGQGKGSARGAPEVDLDDDPGGMYRRTMDAMLEAWEQPGALDRETALPVGRGRASQRSTSIWAKRSCMLGSRKSNGTAVPLGC